MAFGKLGVRYMDIIRFGYAVAIATCCFLLLCCSVKLDFSSLTFKEDGRKTDVAPLPEIRTPVDVREDEITEPDIGRRIPPEPVCWDLFMCVLGNDDCYNFQQDKCFDECYGSKEWKDNLAVNQLKGCMADCVPDLESADDLPYCLTVDCASQLLYCINEEGGDKECHQALKCLFEECTEFPDDSWAQYECTVECLGGMDFDEIPELADYSEDCGLASEEGMGEDECIDSLYECLAGSGQKICDQGLICIIGCNDIVCPNTGSDEGEEGECPELNECYFGCLYGMTEEATWTLYDSMHCSWDVEANPFLCLTSLVQCHWDYYGGLFKCAGAIKTIHGFYSNPFGDKQFTHMSGTALQLKNNDPAKESFLQVLACLAEKWDNSPGYGEIKAQAWDKCAGLCGNN